MSRRNVVYVRNVPERAHAEDVKKYFSRFGPIVNVTVPLDYYSRRARGYAFVEFEDHHDANEVVGQRHHRISGNELDCEIARGGRKTPREMRDREHHRPRPRRGNLGGRPGRGMSPRRRSPSYEEGRRPESGYGRRDSYSPRQRNNIPRKHKNYDGESDHSFEKVDPIRSRSRSPN
ncbi:hypothetical protein SNEBB_003292 [Seison nebaliae]|nr:hypothetical protein SNEBB_003292 [Seison nebaliae]